MVAVLVISIFLMIGLIALGAAIKAKFKWPPTRFDVFLIVIFVPLITWVVYHGFIIGHYQINVRNSYGDYDRYKTNGYTIDETTGCIEFVDVKGTKYNFCGTYWISESL